MHIKDIFTPYIHYIFTICTARVILQTTNIASARNFIDDKAIKSNSFLSGQNVPINASLTTIFRFLLNISEIETLIFAFRTKKIIERCLRKDQISRYYRISSYRYRPMQILLDLRDRLYIINDKSNLNTPELSLSLLEIGNEKCNLNTLARKISFSRVNFNSYSNYSKRSLLQLFNT